MKHEDIALYLESAHVKEMQKNFEMLAAGRPSMTTHSSMRDYLITRLACASAQRTGMLCRELLYLRLLNTIRTTILPLRLQVDIDFFLVIVKYYT